VSGNNISSLFTQVTCPAGNADLSVTKTGPSSVVRGNNITYTITVTNIGPAVATNTIVTDTIPSGFTYVSAVGATCSLVGTGAQLSCVLGNLAVNAPTNLSLTFTVPTVTTCTQTTAQNTATVHSDNTDPVSTNNSSQFTTTLTCPTTNSADAGVTLTGPSTVVSGNNVTYSLSATNTGPATAQSALVRFPVPTYLTYQSASLSGGSCSLVGSEVDCNLGNMTNGQTTPITLNFSTPSTCTSTLTTQATAIISSSTNDPNSSNNVSQTVTTTITCNGSTGNITVYKTDNLSSANVNDSVRYSIVLTNNGGSSANNLTVTDPVPYGINITSASDGGTVNGQTVTWTNLSVGANSSRSIYIDGTVRSDVTDGTVLTNTVYVNNVTASDQTTIRNNSNNYYSSSQPCYYCSSQPYYPPTYYPPSSTPYYPPTTYYPPAYIPLPQTGTRGQQFYSGQSSDASLVKPVEPTQPTEPSSNYSAVFYATMVTMLAVGSAAASRLIGGMF